MTLTRRDLVERISQETGLEKKQLYDVLQRILDCIAESLGNGDRVELRQFGVFEIRVRKQRIGRNPKKPAKDMVIPAKCIVKFRSGRELTELVLKLPVNRKY